VIDLSRRSELAAALIAYACDRRWFRSKARKRTGARVADVIALDAELAIALLEVTYAEGEPETYVIPLAESGPGPAIAPGLFDAIASERFGAALMHAMRDGAAIGAFTGRALPALREIAADAPLAPRASTVEQTNSSIIYGDKLMLKIFRVVSDGESPEAEIGTFLARCKPPFRGSPRLAGILEIGGSTLGTLFEFVPNQGDAWKLTLDSIARYFASALAGSAELAPYIDHVRLLGQRTAELHVALASDARDAAFAPEPFDAAHQQTIAESIRAQAAKTFALLPGETAAAAAIERTAAQLTSRTLSAIRTRTHGDYHLGQVLWTGRDFLIIDFEGEPSRSLAERRRKASPLRDVAGMLRSLDYAAGAALRADHHERDRAALEGAARAWTERTSAAFLAGYYAAAEGTPIVPARADDRDLLLRAFLLEKVLYEIAYELNNRPDWVAIPLRGLRALEAAP
jgi:maltose alpha-D-glucosyltransferase/alpha-amylase